MKWKIAAAKQHLSEIVRQAATEPQILMNRDRPVAVVIAVDDVTAIHALGARRPRPISESLEDATRICAEEDYTLKTQARSDRANPFLGGKRASARHQRRQ